MQTLSIIQKTIIKTFMFKWTGDTQLPTSDILIGLSAREKNGQPIARTRVTLTTAFLTIVTSSDYMPDEISCH